MNKAKSIFETFEKEFADYVLIGEFIDGESFEIFGIGDDGKNNKNRVLKIIGRLEFVKSILTKQLMDIDINNCDEDDNYIDNYDSNEGIF